MKTLAIVIFATVVVGAQAPREAAAPTGDAKRGKTLFDQTYKTDGQEFSSIGSIRTVYYGAPRTFMVRAGVHF